MASSSVYRGTVWDPQAPSEHKYGASIYGTKATTKLMAHKRHHKVKVSKRGFGWSGCTPAAEKGKFWVASDNYKKSVFRVDFETGAAEKFKLSHHHGNLEGMSSAPGLWPDEDVFFINASCSLNKVGQTMGENNYRNRLSLCRLPKTVNAPAPGTVKEKTYHFTNGENMYVWENVSRHILGKLAEQAVMDPTASNYLDVEVDASLAAKHGGLDIEGIAFTHADHLRTEYRPNPREHILWLGLRGPVTRDGNALLVPVSIPIGTVTDTSTWSAGYAYALATKGYGLRDMHFDAEHKKLLILAGPLHQDKSHKEVSQYPLFSWDIFRQPRTPTHVANVPRLLNGSLNHGDLQLPVVENLIDSDDDEDEGEVDKKKYKKKEKPEKITVLDDVHKEAIALEKEKKKSMSSPEGISKLDDKLLVCWDHNDMGVFATFPYPDLTQ